MAYHLLSRQQRFVSHDGSRIVAWKRKSLKTAVTMQFVAPGNCVAPGWEYEVMNYNSEETMSLRLSREVLRTPMSAVTDLEVRESSSET